MHPRSKPQEEIVVVVGGEKKGESATNSVHLLLNATEKSNCRQWIEGPAMNEARSCHAAVVCNGSVYVIGGHNYRRSFLNTIERIDMIDLLSPKNLDKKNQWETLTCRLSHKRATCSAVAIQNRYIVVVGGCGKFQRALASVEIIDTVQQSQPYLFPGPPLNVPRCYVGMTVIGSCIYVVGGVSLDFEAEGLKSVEYLKLSDSRCVETRNNATSLFPSTLSWAIHEELALSESRWGHAVARVGSCVVVSGGWPRSSQPVLQSVEIMDTKCNKVWKMVPEMTVPRRYHNMVALSTGIICISGLGENSCEILSLIDKNSAVFRNLLLGTNGTRLCLKEM